MTTIEGKGFIVGLFKVKATPETNKPDGYELELIAEVTPILARDDEYWDGNEKKTKESA